MFIPNNCISHLSKILSIITTKWPDTRLSRVQFVREFILSFFTHSRIYYLFGKFLIALWSFPLSQPILDIMLGCPSSPSPSLRHSRRGGTSVFTCLQPALAMFHSK